MLSEPSIAVIGAGSWGTALALLLARNQNSVRLWTRDLEQMNDMLKDKENKSYLPGFPFPSNISVYADLTACLQDITDILIVVPSHAFREVLLLIKPIAKNPRIAWGSKGLDPDTCQLLHDVVAQEFSSEIPVAALSGPSFAKEVAANKPTAVSLAGNNEDFLQSLVNRLHNDFFRVYLNSDLPGVELCGAIKNVLAIAVGVSDGLELGANARCALITRGLAEMTRLCVAMGGKPETLMGLCGVGDLVLTCTDNQSRNRRFGLALGRGVSANQALKEIGQVVEGLKNAEQVRQLAKQYKIEMPIAEQVYAVTHEQQSPQAVLSELLAREPKIES